MRTADKAIEYGTWALGTIAISLGMTMILQESSRMASPAWQQALTIMSADLWGVYMSALGCVMLIAICFDAWKWCGAAAVAISVAILGRTITSVMALDQPSASGTAPQFLFLVTALYLAHGITLLRRP